jgi:hypothetical protein
MLPIGARCGTVGNVPPFVSGAPTRWSANRGNEFWVSRFELAQLDEQDVVFRVGEVAVAAVVVLIIREADAVAQFGEALGGGHGSVRSVG